MFEQAVLCPAPLRRWAVTLGFAGEVAAVGCLLVIPLLFPELLPRRELISWITTPLPPAPIIRETTFPHVQPVHRPMREGAIWYPAHPILQPLVALDEPPAQISGVSGGTGDVQAGNALAPILDSAIRIEPPKRTPEAVAVPAPNVAPKPLERIRIGGAVQAARLIHRVEPVYPALARQMRISGTVELAGVIAANGAIRELRVTSGHPLLVRAALDAVQQWAYQPTLLGADPVEVVTTISVVFRLN